MSILIDLTQVRKYQLEVDVDFYDNKEKMKLSKYPNFDEIEKIISNKKILIPFSEFLTYYLFYKKRQTKLKWSNYQAIKRNIDSALKDLEDFVEHNGKSIYIPKDVQYQVNAISERIGESIGLSLINRIHNLIEADWGKIKEMRGPRAYPTFDYQIAASDGKRIIHVENKGSSVKDNRKKNAAIYSHYGRIIEKKRKISNAEKLGSYPYDSNIKYGTITAIDYRNNGLAKCWLLDSPNNFIKINPSKYKLLTRLNFFREWISFIFPRSQISSALATRINSLHKINNPFELDNTQLINSNNEPFNIKRSTFFYRDLSWFNNKSRVIDEPIGGVVFQISKNRILFLGIREEIINLVIKQKFDLINNYKAETGNFFKTVNCVISKGRLKEFKIPENIELFSNPHKNYFSLRAYGNLNFTSGGVVWGVLSLIK